MNDGHCPCVGFQRLGPRRQIVQQAADRVGVKLYHFGQSDSRLARMSMRLGQALSGRARLLDILTWQPDFKQTIRSGN
jgi:hypothetical protein